MLSTMAPSGCATPVVRFQLESSEIGHRTKLQSRTSIQINTTATKIRSVKAWYGPNEVNRNTKSRIAERMKEIFWGASHREATYEARSSP